MPEGDTIFRAARTLQRALAGQVVTKFESALPQVDPRGCGLRSCGPHHRKSGSATENGCLMHFSGDLVLLTHMLMSGSWHIYRPG